MRSNVRVRIFLFCLGVLLASLALADRALTRLVEQRALDQAARDLAVRLTLVSREAARVTAALEDTAVWDQLAKSSAITAGARVIIARPDGTVAGDSDRSAGAPADGSPSAERAKPEEEPARLGAPTTTTRGGSLDPSVAASGAFTTAGGARAILKLSRPVDEAKAVVVAVERILGVGVIASLILSVLVAAMGPRVITGDVADLSDAVRRMSRGDLNVKLRLEQDDPYAPLGKALEQIGENLTRSVAALRSERDLLGRILEGMEEGVMVLDDSRRVILLNRALSSVLFVGPRPTWRAGKGDDGPLSGAPSPLDAAGKSLLEIAMNPELEALLDHAQAEGGRATDEIELGDFKPRRLLVRATRLEGAPWGFLLVFVDVTEVRRLESLRRDFVANVSHELRTPVASVRTAAETVRTAMARDQVAAERFVGIIERNAERLQSLVEDLLDLSRIESREYRLNVERLEAGKIVTDVASLFRERADSRRLRIMTAVADDVPVLHTDRRALEQVLVNLVDNAVKYCPEEATITLHASGEDNGVVFAVQDTGAGIDSIHLPRLFERFYRVDPGRTRDRGGTGLGLAIVKHLVEAMGGHVSVKSTVGQGTTFTVRLPALAPARRTLRAS